MGILLAINGYLTIAGLVVEGIGGLMEVFSPETAKPVQQLGAGMTVLGATRKGVKKYKGMPVF